MATLDQLSTALVNADKAGDADAARALAAEIQRMRATPTVQPSWQDQEAQANLQALQSGGIAPTQPVADPNDKSHVGSLWPISIDKAGNGSFDSNAGILGAIKQAVTAPGRAMSGDLQVMGQDGNVTQEAIGEGLNFAGLASPMAPELRAGGRIVPGEAGAFRPAKVEPPSAAQLRTAADNGYEAVRGMGVEYSSQHVADMARKAQAALEEKGIIGELAPQSFSILQKLQNPPANSTVPFSGLEAARRIFGQMGKNFNNPTDQLAAGTAKRALDDFMAGPPDGAVLAGPAEKAARSITDARGNYAASARSNSLTGIGEAADLRAAAANSGQNVGNSIRSRVASALLSPKATAGFTDAETAALEKIVNGTPAQNALRYGGNLLGGGGGLGAAVTGGIAGTAAAASTGNPMMAAAGIAAPIVGAISKKVSNKLTERALGKADEMTRMRSPLYDEMAKAAPNVPVIPKNATAATRALWLSQHPEATDQQPMSQSMRDTLESQLNGNNNWTPSQRAQVMKLLGLTQQ